MSVNNVKIENVDSSTEEYKYVSIPRRSRIVPYGYKVDPNNITMLVPIDKEMNALIDAYWYLIKGYSYRSVAAWLTRQTGRYISHAGLAESYRRFRLRYAVRRTHTKEAAKECAEETAGKDSFARGSPFSRKDPTGTERGKPFRAETGATTTGRKRAYKRETGRRPFI